MAGKEGEMKKTNDLVRRFKKSVLGNYGRTPPAFVRGKGSWLWDAEGKRYLDMIPGLGAGALGHCNPKVVAAIRRQAGRLIHVQNTYYLPVQGELARALCRLAGFDGRVFFCNSGAEANEAALKLARRRAWSRGEGKRREIVSIKDSFHGRTYGALAATGGANYRKGFSPLPAGFRRIPLNDSAAARRAIGKRTAAVIVEPILGEGGIQEPSVAFLKELRALTRRRKALLIFDEVQSGCGRTGVFFAHSLFKIKPDVITLAKPLAGGLPIGAMIVHAKYAKALPPGSHASTFGGSPLVCAAGLAALKQAASPALLGRVRARGRQLRAGLQVLKRRHPRLVRDVRGRGLMAGLGLSRPGASIVERCRELGLLINCTHGKVLRFLPALTVKPAEIARLLAILGKVLAEADSKRPSN
jgi:acetylornithine/N-succinyldiaminopimelate aminotransferase